MLFKTKWYFHINLSDNTVIEYTPLPSHIGEVEIDGLNENQLSNLNIVGINEGFMTEPAALAHGISQALLNESKERSKEFAESLNNNFKQSLIEIANHEDVNRAWGRFSDQERGDILSYRQQLAEMVTTEVFNPVWPEQPEVLVNFYINK